MSFTCTLDTDTIIIAQKSFYNLKSCIIYFGNWIINNVQLIAFYLTND